MKFNNAFASNLAILAALDSNRVANRGLRKYSLRLSAPVQLATVGLG